MGPTLGLFCLNGTTRPTPGVPDLHTTLKVDVDFSKKSIFRVLRAKKRRFFKLKKVYLSVLGLQKKQIF